jgi:hypothetical protein
MVEKMSDDNAMTIRPSLARFNNAMIAIQQFDKEWKKSKLIVDKGPMT